MDFTNTGTYFVPFQKKEDVENKIQTINQKYATLWLGGGNNYADYIEDKDGIFYLIVLPEYVGEFTEDELAQVVEFANITFPEVREDKK